MTAPRRLYLPAVWAQDAPRRRDTGVPEEITFATKPELGIAMLRGAVDRSLPFAWVTAASHATLMTTLPEV